MYKATHRLEKAHEDGIWGVCWTNTGHVISGSVDETAKVWTDDLSPVHTLGGHRLGVLNIRTNSNGSVIATSSIDSCIRLWDLISGSQTGIIEAGPMEAWTLDIDSNDSLIGSGTQQGCVNLWDFTDHK
eukprot:265413_1